MKLRTHWPLYLLLVAFAVFGMRFAWALAHSTTGWKPHRDQWIEVAAGVVGIEWQQLGDRDPAEQARFWLDEVSHVASVERDARAAAGTAWILDAPDAGFARHRDRMKGGFARHLASSKRETDDEDTPARFEAFESLCRGECLTNIESATRLEPENVEWWRARALLLFQSRYRDIGLKPRREDWLAVLDECAKHDPGNALYDYLAAYHYWSSSARYRLRADGFTIQYKDRRAFDQGRVRLAAGLAKPHLKFGDGAYAAVLAFLDESSISRSDHPDIAGSRWIVNRATAVTNGLFRWQKVLMDAETRDGNLDRTLDTAHEVLRMADQITEEGNYAQLYDPKSFLRAAAWSSLQNLAEAKPEVFSEDETAQIVVEQKNALLDREILAIVGQQSMPRSFGTSATFQVWLIVLLQLAQSLAIVALGAALLFGFVAWVFGAAGHEQPAALGWSKHVAAWLGGIGVSFVLLGMLPSVIDSPAGWLPVTAWLSPTVSRQAGLVGVTPLEIETAMDFERTKWGWAFIQWHLHQGERAAPWLAAVFVLAWYLMRRARRTEGECREPSKPSKRGELRLAGRVVARSCLVAALVFLLGYLATAPLVADGFDVHYRARREQLADPARTWEEIEAVSAEIHSDM